MIIINRTNESSTKISSINRTVIIVINRTVISVINRPDECKYRILHKFTDITQHNTFVYYEIMTEK